MTHTKRLSPIGETEPTLAELEQIIQDGLDTFIEVGNALVRIRDKQLYVDGYSSFDQYCRERWDMSGSHAYRLIDASEVVRELPEGTPAPVNEAQARELAKVPPEDRAEVMKEASQATGGKPTAAAVKAAATKREAEKRTTRRKPASKPAATKPADEEAGKEEPACGPIAEPGDIVPYWIEVGIDRISNAVKSPHLTAEQHAELSEHVDSWQEQLQQRHIV